MVATHAVAIVGGDVGRSDQREAQIVVDKTYPAVVRFEIDHAGGEAAHELVPKSRVLPLIGAGDRKALKKLYKYGGRYRDRTCDPFHVKEVLYR